MAVYKINSDIALQQSAQNRVQRIQTNDFEKNLKSAFDENDDKKLKQVSADLESVFTNMMLKEMRNSVMKSELLESSSSGKSIFEGMLDEKISDLSSKGKGIGLADMIYKQVSREMKNRYKIDE